MTTAENQFLVRFWGVRGSIACPGPETVRYGGNTPCVEVQAGKNRLIFDGGTGLRVLGQHLLKELPVTAHLFFTHSHWDHIQGFPFFVPAFIPGNCFNIYDTIAPDGSRIEQRLSGQMLHPNFPVPLQIMGSDLHFHDLEVEKPLDLGEGLVVENALLNHPGEAVGYRINWQGHGVAYVTDTEHFPDRLDENVLKLAQDADVLIYDATYTDMEYSSEKSSKVGWGHSTWQEGVKLAEAAKVKTFVIFHHDPLHNDDFLDEMGKAAADRFPGAVMAKEGMVLSLLD
ncbi:MAG: MBL fold metallo-hydrolase [Prochlorothrix sp.]|nr:MBL fold metallo-hydrolase [Prochlorothrix sp.]